MCELGKRDLMLKSSGTCHLSNSPRHDSAPNKALSRRPPTVGSCLATSTDVGTVMGKQIGKLAAATYLRPLR
jgi:hypothetical protein